jgi:hypothetical protein
VARRRGGARIMGAALAIDNDVLEYA